VPVDDRHCRGVYTYVCIITLDLGKQIKEHAVLYIIDTHSTGICRYMYLKETGTNV
jgi:DUF971 family protein